MGRILALDYGTKRVGVAVSDPLGLIAGALDTVPANQIVAFLKHYTGANAVDTIVLGLPRRMDGTPSDTYAAVQQLAARLKKELPGVGVEFYDERFTSVLAQRALIDSGVKKMARREKGLVDRVSATIILQDYLQYRKA